MKKTKFFTEDSIEKLQRNVNNWLSNNNAIYIIRTDMQVASIVNKAIYCFYILYGTSKISEQELIAEQMESVIPAEQILPDVKSEDIITPDKDIYNKV
jgi:hypothetical protein